MSVEVAGHKRGKKPKETDDDSLSLEVFGDWSRSLVREIYPQNGRASGVLCARGRGLLGCYTSCGAAASTAGGLRISANLKVIRSFSKLWLSPVVSRVHTVRLWTRRDE